MRLFWRDYKSKIQSITSTIGSIRERNRLKVWRIFATILLLYWRKVVKSQLQPDRVLGSCQPKMSQIDNFSNCIRAVYVLHKSHLERLSMECQLQLLLWAGKILSIKDKSILKVWIQMIMAQVRPLCLSYIQTQPSRRQPRILATKRIKPPTWTSKQFLNSEDLKTTSDWQPGTQPPIELNLAIWPLERCRQLHTRTVVSLKTSSIRTQCRWEVWQTLMVQDQTR